MKRVLMSVMSFFIFILEILFQIIFLLFNTIKTIPPIFVLCILRYHNRIQWWTSKNNIFVTKEIKNANI